MSYDAIEVAKWILSVAKRHGISMTHMKLQKLLYYAQAYVIGMTGIPLFSNEIQAWQHGPVVPDVYSKYSKYGHKTIAEFEDVDIPEEYSGLIEMLMSDKGSYSASTLREMTHEEPVWQNAYLNSSREINLATVSDYFTPLFWTSDEEDEYQPSFDTLEQERIFLQSELSDEERKAIVETR